MGNMKSDSVFIALFLWFILFVQIIRWVLWTFGFFKFNVLQNIFQMFHNRKKLVSKNIQQTCFICGYF